MATKAKTQPEVDKSDAQWRQTLSPDRYHVLREQGTEPPGSSPLLEEHRPGVFRCAACGEPLFSSDAKFESGSGWPSFWAPVEDGVETEVDTSHGMVRTEMHCRKCGSHLGHVFDDGPRPTGLRYCTNGLSLKFEPR